MSGVPISIPVPGIARFPIELPGNPLKELNCYVILGGETGRNLLVDTGFHQEACTRALLAGMEMLKLTPENTDIFFTHLHSDHTGNGRELQDRGYFLIMGRIDYGELVHNDWDGRKRRALAEGMPRDVMEEIFRYNPATVLASGPFKARTVEDGDELCYGEYRFRCILCPGHTPGHICLYDSEKKTMLTGDHVLFDITPNITSRGLGTNALGDYLESLKRVRFLEVEHALPGHRGTGQVSYSERIGQLLEHHARRIAETEALVKEHPGQTAYEIAGEMKWKIHSRNWAEFPPGQKWFAVFEALSHLEYLMEEGRIRRDETEGLYRYFAQ